MIHEDCPELWRHVVRHNLGKTVAVGNVNGGQPTATEQPPPAAELPFSQDELTKILMDTHGRYESMQDRSAAIIKRLNNLRPKG